MALDHAGEHWLSDRQSKASLNIFAPLDESPSMLKCVQRLLQHHASEPIILFSSAQARCQDRSRRDRSEPTPENARDPCIGPRTRRGLIQVKGVTLPRATLGTDPRFGAMRMWPRLLSLEEGVC